MTNSEINKKIKRLVNMNKDLNYLTLLLKHNKKYLSQFTGNVEEEESLKEYIDNIEKRIEYLREELTNKLNCVS